MQHLLTDISLVGVVTREVYRLLSLGKPMTVRQLMVTGSLREEPVRNALQRGVKQGWAVEAGPVLVANSVGRMGSAKTYLTAGKLKEKATTAGIIEIALATRTPLELAWSGVVA